MDFLEYFTLLFQRFSNSKISCVECTNQGLYTPVLYRLTFIVVLVSIL